LDASYKSAANSLAVIATGFVGGRTDSEFQDNRLLLSVLKVGRC
jgi:hypothetical protein